jgi:hypothetical protein
MRAHEVAVNEFQIGSEAQLWEYNMYSMLSVGIKLIEHEAQRSSICLVARFKIL